jgi:superfamily I DNA/RNA helicase
MKLQALIDETDLNMSEAQIRAFYLGSLNAEKKLPFSKVMAALLAEAPEAKAQLGDELEKLWQEVAQHEVRELENFFPAASSDVMDFLELAQLQIDYFLTAMSLAGTNAETAKHEELGELIEYLEETLEELDEFLADGKPDPEQGEEMREDLLSNWKDFIDSKQAD